MCVVVSRRVSSCMVIECDVACVVVYGDVWWCVVMCMVCDGA